MKTHYWVLVFLCIINFIMACSLNSVTEPLQYKSALFLYFLSNLASFVERYVSYKDAEQRVEKIISEICFGISTLVILIYIMDLVNCIEIAFQEDNGLYHVLIQGAENSLIAFDSFEITEYIVILALVIPISYILFCVIANLRESKYTMESIKQIVVINKWKVGVISAIALVSGIVSRWVCNYRYQRKYEGYGSPQYLKYFLFFFGVVFVLGMVILIKFNKDILEHKQLEKKETIYESKNNLLKHRHATNRKKTKTHD